MGTTTNSRGTGGTDDVVRTLYFICLSKTSVVEHIVLLRIKIFDVPFGGRKRIYRRRGERYPDAYVVERNRSSGCLCRCGQDMLIISRHLASLLTLLLWQKYSEIKFSYHILFPSLNVWTIRSSRTTPDHPFLGSTPTVMDVMESQQSSSFAT